MYDISPLLNTPIKYLDTHALARKKDKYLKQMKDEVYARCYTLQQIELTRLTQFSKTELETLVGQFQELDPQMESLGLNFDLFSKVICSIFKWQFDEYFMQRLFTVFDNDQDMCVDFKELIHGISVLCRGSVHQKMKLIFKVIDSNDDQLVDKVEMTKILQHIYNVINKSQQSPLSRDTTPKTTNNHPTHHNSDHNINTTLNNLKNSKWFNWEWEDPHNSNHDNTTKSPTSDNSSSEDKKRTITRSISLNQRIFKMFGRDNDSPSNNTTAHNKTANIGLNNKTTVTISDGSFAVQQPQSQPQPKVQPQTQSQPQTLSQAHSQSLKSQSDLRTTKRPLLFTRASSSRELINRIGFGSSTKQQPTTIATSKPKPKPKVDISKEVAFFVDILFKAAQEYIVMPAHLQPASLTRRASMRIPINTNPNCMNFDQFKEVILLQPMVVECFNLNASSILHEAPVTLIVK